MFKRIWKALSARAEVDECKNGEIPSPPSQLQQFVGGDFVAVGNEFVGHLRGLCSLNKDGAILDIGCGSGRIAIPLTKYLSDLGLYRGFDVSKEAINWCQRNVSRRYPNFEFSVADVKNGPYNPRAPMNPSEYRFPYPDDLFDVVFLASVFTHMFPPDIKNYLREIFRVLKSGGRCLATFFVLNEESIRLTSEKRGKLNFEYSGDGYRSIDERTPEEGLAYSEAFVRTTIEECGLILKEPILSGSWCGREKYLSFQDITISVKPN